MPPVAGGPQKAQLDWHEQVPGHGRLGVRIASLVAHLRTVVRLPIRTIEHYLADLHGLRIGVGAHVALLHRGTEHEAPAVAQIREQARAGAGINGRLGEDVAGVLITDFSAAYNDTSGGQHQCCWVHLVRDAHMVVQTVEAQSPE